MADLVGKLGQTIKGSVSNFGAGFKQAAISGNPALFGAALGTMEKAFSKKFDEDKKERAKDREERRRDRQFDEEKENEQKKVDSDILKSLRNIEKLMEALLGKKGDKEGGSFVAVLGNLRKLFGPLLTGLTAFLASLDDVLSDILKAFSGWAKKLAGKGLGIIDDLLKAFNNFFKNIFDKIKSLKIGAFVDDLLQNFKNFFKGLFDRFKATSLGQFIDDALKSVKGFFNNLFTQISKLGKFFDDIGKNIGDGFKALKAGRISELIGEIGTKIKSFFGGFFDDIAKKIPKTFDVEGGIGTKIKSFFGGFFDDIAKKIPKIFDVEIDLFKRVKDVFKSAFFEGRLVQSLDDLAEVFSDKGPLGKFAATLGLVFETLKTGVVDKVGGVFTTISDFFKGIAELPIVAKIIELGEGGLKKIFKAIPVIGNLIMVIEGIFEAFDTESLADSLQKAQKDIGFGDRVVGFLGGLIGSIFGILDLIPMAIKALFGIDMTFEDGETIQKKATRLITGFIGDFFGYFSGLFTVIGGLLTADSNLMKKGLLEMELIVEDWLFGFKNFFGGIIKVPFAKMTNAVAGAIEYMVNGIIGAINSFVAFVLDKLAVIPGAGGLAGKAKEALKVEKVTIGRMDESPYKPEQSRRSVTAQKIRELEKQEAAASVSPTSTGYKSTNVSNSQPLSVRNNNPGNLRYYAKYAGPGGVLEGAIPGSEGSFAMFPTPEAGMAAMQKQIRLDTQTRGMTLTQFISKYAPASDNNDTQAYIMNMARSLGIGPNEQIPANRISELQSAMIRQEGGPAAANFYSGVQVRGRGGQARTIPVSDSDKAEKIIEIDVELPKKSQNEIAVAEAVSDAIIESPNRDNQQIVLMQNAEKREIMYRQEDNRYRQERQALEEQFYSTLENGYKNILTAMAGGFNQGAPGSGRNAIEQAIAPGVQKLAEKIFGKEMGGQVGSIFTKLAGSYADQIIETVLTPAFFGGDSKQANRFMGSLASGNKKNAMEDLIYGMTGAATGMRSAIGYDEGAAQIAKELATLTGTPFSPLFNLDKDQKRSQDEAKLVTDPIVAAQYDSMNELANRILDQSRPGGGTMVIGPDGRMISTSQATSSYYGGPSGVPGYAGGLLATPGFGGPSSLDATTKALGNLGSLFLGRTLGVDTSTFGGSLAQGGLTTAIQAGLTGQNIMTALQGYNMVSGMGRNIAVAGGNIFGAQGAGGVQQMIGSGMASFGGGMSLGASGGFQNMANFGAMNTAGQVGYVAGVIGAAMTAKSISDAFSGGYKSGVGDAVAIVGSFFDPTGGLISGTVGAVVNRLFGRKAPEVTDSGIVGTLKTDSASLKGYTDILEKGGTYRSDKRYTNYSALPPELVKNIGDALKSLTQGIKDTGKLMGLDRKGATGAYQTAYNKLLTGSFKQEVRISLKGKSEEEIKEALQKMVEDFSDAYIRDAFGTVLNKFQKQGERLFETFDRLTKAAIGMTDVTEKLRYNFSLLKLSADEFQAASLADRFFDLAGGIEKYAKDVQFYFEQFYTKEEQLEYAAEKGRDLMQRSLESVGLDVSMSVKGLTDIMGENFEDARKAYRKVVEDFIKANGGMEKIVKKGDPKVIEQLAKMQGELAQEYFATTKALQELDRIKGTSKEALTGAARAVFMADIAAAKRSFAVGGIASGPKSGYGAMLHGTEAVVPLPDSREIPVELRISPSELGSNRTFINNIVGNGNSTVRSTPTNVITSSPQATSGSSSNRVISSAY
jgi:hypothetical protein